MVAEKFLGVLKLCVPDIRSLIKIMMMTGTIVRCEHKQTLLDYLCALPRVRDQGDHHLVAGIHNPHAENDSQVQYPLLQPLNCGGLKEVFPLNRIELGLMDEYALDLKTTTTQTHPFIDLKRGTYRMI